MAYTASTLSASQYTQQQGGNTLMQRTCWSNCPNTTAVTALLRGCPSTYPNVSKPDCTPKTCWSECPTNSVMTYGSCPNGYPYTSKPTCYSPETQVDMNAIEESNPWGNETAGSGNGSGSTWESATQDGGKGDDDQIITQICWSGCPNSYPISVIGSQCISAYPFSDKPNCGDDTSLPNTDNEELLALLEASQLEQQAFVDQSLAQITTLQAQLAQAQANQNNDDEVQALMAMYALQQEQLNQALASQNTPQVDALTSQLNLLQNQLVQSQNRPASNNTEAIQGLQSQMSMLSQILMNQQSLDVQKAGSADLPSWAIPAGIGVLALVAIVMTMKK